MNPTMTQQGPDGKEKAFYSIKAFVAFKAFMLLLAIENHFQGLLQRIIYQGLAV